MAVSKKGARPIVVDDVPYRWRVRGRPSYWQGIGQDEFSFVVQHAQKAGAVLVVQLPYPHPSNWLRMPSVSVLPSDVAQHIKQAINDGWQPTEPGEPFRRLGSMPKVFNVQR